jgi:hypothetical protein
VRRRRRCHLCVREKESVCEYANKIRVKRVRKSACIRT